MVGESRMFQIVCMETGETVMVLIDPISLISTVFTGHPKSTKKL